MIKPSQRIREIALGERAKHSPSVPGSWAQQMAQDALDFNNAVIQYLDEEWGKNKPICRPLLDNTVSGQCKHDRPEGHTYCLKCGQ